MQKNKYNYIIWDWNGTLYNDVFAGMDTVNDMLKERGLDPMDTERYKEIFTFPIIDYYKAVGFDFSIEPYEQLAEIFIQKNNARLGESFLYSDAIDLLNFVSERGIHQIILSATRQDILLEQVSYFGISKYFDVILGKKDFFAYGKSEIAINWLKNTNISASRVLFVGDTIHDYEVAKEINCDCVLVADGHQSKARLKNTKAKVVSSLVEIKSLL